MTNDTDRRDADGDRIDDATTAAVIDDSPATRETPATEPAVTDPATGPQSLGVPDRYRMANDTDSSAPDESESDTTPKNSTAVHLSDTAVDAVAIVGLAILGYAAFMTDNTMLAQTAMFGIAALAGVKMYRRAT